MNIRVHRIMTKAQWSGGVVISLEKRNQAKHCCVELHVGYRLNFIRMAIRESKFTR